MKVLVCGGRYYDEWRTLQRALAAIHADRPISLLITGGAPGADRMAQKWAEVERLPVAVFPANWSHMGRRAGPIRNAVMLREMRPALVVAFPGAAGTADMVAKAQAAGVPVEFYPTQPAKEGVKP